MHSDRLSLHPVPYVALANGKISGTFVPSSVGVLQDFDRDAICELIKTFAVSARPRVERYPARVLVLLRAQHCTAKRHPSAHASKHG